MKKKLRLSLIGGVILGIACVIGAYVRSSFTANPEFIFGLWYNRVIIGLVIGAPWAKIDKAKRAVRGGIFGLMVSFAFYATTGFADPVSFIAGMVYGIILELGLEALGE